MAFKPEPMQRTVILASRAHQRSVIETLHALRAAHLVDFAESREGDLAEFRIGRPLPEGSSASEKVVRVRSLIRQLGLEGQGAKRSFPVRELEAKLASAVVQVEQDIHSAAESRSRVAAQIEALRDEESRLRPLASLPLNLEDYLGYENLQPFVGFVSGDAGEAAAEVSRVAPEALVLRGSSPEAPIAIFAPKARAEAVNDVLFKAGWREHTVPAGSGPIADRLGAIESERRALEERLSRAEHDLADLREKHGDFLIALEEHLTIEVAKAEAPLSFATTENAFAVDAWMPESRVKEVEAALINATRGNVHVERVKHVATAMHGMDDVHGGHDAHDAGHHEAQAQPPTMLRHGGYSKPFGFFTEMFSMPKYDEIDPTVVLSIAFPLFLGFMIGDLGLGLLMVLLGLLMARKLKHIEGLRELGIAIFVAGLVASAVGGVVFQDAFGMPFGVPVQEVEHLEHEGLLALDAAGHPVLTDEGAAVFGHGAVAGSAFTCLQFAEHVGEWPWTCTFSGKEAAVVETHPLLTKLGDQQTILLLSIVAAIVHLTIGLLFGIANEWAHSKKHAAAKMSWLVILFALVPAVLFLLAPEKLGMLGLTEGNALLVTGVGVLIGGAGLGITEGVIGVLEIPSMLSNLLSYLRLGAVAIAKGAMAVAFNRLTIVDVAVVKGGVLFVVIGFVAFILVQILLFVLGLLSSGIQAIRLNYVEFFTKFYKGGGEKFSPFGHVRRYSAPSGTVGGGKL